MVSSRKGVVLLAPTSRPCCAAVYGMWARCRVIHLLLVRLWFFIWQHLQILFCYVSRFHFLGKVYLPSGRTRKYQKCTAGCSISVYAVWHFHNLFSRLIVLFRFAKSGRSRLLLYPSQRFCWCVYSATQPVLLSAAPTVSQRRKRYFFENPFATRFRDES